MNVSTIATLTTATLTNFSNEVFIVLTAVLGVAIAYFLFKFAWRKIKGSVQPHETHLVRKKMGLWIRE